MLAGCAGWSNWAGNERCQPKRIARPATLAELRDVVRTSAHLRVAGAGHSWSKLVCTDEVLVDTRSLTRLLSVDEGARRIRVEAGMRLKDLDQLVAQHGLALATEPTISEITVGGAIATASHGTGLAHGAFSEEVVALDVIDGAGQLVTLDSPDDLRAARVGLGTLGVIYSITFRLVPAFNLEIYERVVDEKQAFEGIEQRVADNQHVDMFWFVTEHKVFLRTYHRTDAPIHVTHPARDPIEEWVVRTWIGQFGLATVGKIPGIKKLLNKVEPSLFPDQTTTDRSDHVFHRFPGHQKVYSMEYLVPIERTHDALQAIKDSLAATKFYPNMPPYLRFVGGAGDGDLSPLRGRSSCAIEVLSYTGFKGWEQFFRDLEPRFLALGGRPHWGMLFFANPRALYDAAAWANVERLRARLDPHHTLANELTRTLFTP